MVRVVRLERTVSWSQTRRDTNFAIPGYSISAMIPRRAEKIKFFLSVVIYVVKTAFVPFSAIGGNPANAGVTRLCGILPCPVPDTATALPNHAFYQLNYTRIFNFCHDTTARGKNKVFSVCGHLCGQSRFYAVYGNRGKSSKRRCHKALRRFYLPRPGYRHGTPKASALPTAQPPEIFIFTCAAIRCALLCSPGLRFPKKSSRYSPARFFRPLSVRYDNFNSIIDFLPEVNG